LPLIPALSADNANISATNQAAIIREVIHSIPEIFSDLQNSCVATRAPDGVEITQIRNSNDISKRRNRTVCI